MRLVLELSVIAILLMINAVLAASELAIVSARKTRLRPMADDGNRAARQVLAMQESPADFLAAVQVGITLAGFFASAVGAVSLVDKFSGVLENVGVGFIANNSHLIALILITALLSFVSIIVGELIPEDARDRARRIDRPANGRTDRPALARHRADHRTS